MSQIKLPPTTLPSNVVTGSKLSGSAQGIIEGGCVPPGRFPKLPGDDFGGGRPGPIGGCFPPPGGGGVSPVYQWQLRNMSTEQLQQEKFTQELNLLVAQFTGDTRGAADARAKLGAIGKEEVRRMFDGGGLEMAMYRNKLNHMSDSQLSAEGRKQQMAYLFAKITGNEPAAQKAMQKLDAVRQEQQSREWTPFPFPRPLDINKLDLTSMTQDGLRDLSQNIGLDSDLAAKLAMQ